MKRIIKNEKISFLICLILTFLVLTAPLLIRFMNKDPLIFGQQPYLHLTKIDKKLDYSYLSYMGRDCIFDIYDYLLSFVCPLFSINFIFFFQLILGITSMVMFYILIKKLNLKLLTRFLVMLTLILSPIFIYTFTSLNKHSLVIFLILTGLLFFTSERKILNILSIPIFIIISFFNFLATLTILLLILCYVLNKKEKIKEFYIILALTIFCSTTYYLTIYLKYGFPRTMSFVSVNYLQNLLSDLGSLAGLAFFNLILTVIGIVVAWKHKRKLWLVYITIIILLISLSYLNYSNIYLKFITTVFTGLGFYRLVSMRWNLKFIRNLTIFILILGLIFSTTSYINRLVNSLPDKNIKESLEWLEVYSDPEDIVLSHYSRGFWIEYFAQRAVVMDSFFFHAPTPNERYRDMNAVFYGINLEETKKLLNNYDISYIYIDNEMKQGLVWKKEKQGLLFLFRNEETFKNVYNENGIEIWLYKKE